MHLIFERHEFSKWILIDYYVRGITRGDEGLLEGMRDYQREWGITRGGEGLLEGWGIIRGNEGLLEGMGDY